MTDLIAPPWGTDWKPTLPRGPTAPRDGQWKPGQSGNPRGRPPGLSDRRLLATQQMLDEIRNIIAVPVGKALEGDTNAASIVLAKILPSVKAQAEKVSFDFDATAPISDQVAQVLDAVAAGAVAPDVGRLIIDSINRSPMCGRPRNWPLASRLLRRRTVPERKSELSAAPVKKSAMRPAARQLTPYPDGA